MATVNPARGMPSPHAAPPPSPSDPELHNLDNFDEELQRLSAASRELLESFRGTAALPDEAPPETDEVALLRLENAELRGRVEELEHALLGSGAEGDAWAERQREYEALLEEKSEVIRTLHQKVRELQDRPAPRPASAAHIEVPDGDALLRLKEELDEQRRQLQEDEEAMTSQLRDMEMALSRDRADLARQRQELTRLKADLEREIEQAARDPGLRERLMSLRRPADRPGSNPSVAAPARAAAPAEPQKKGSSGIFRRFFS